MCLSSVSVSLLLSLSLTPSLPPSSLLPSTLPVTINGKNTFGRVLKRKERLPSDGDCVHLRPFVAVFLKCNGGGTLLPDFKFT